MTDARTRAAHAAWKQAAVLRDGFADMEKLPVAESRGCQPMVRNLATGLIDASVELGRCDLVTDPPTALSRATSIPSGLSVISSLAPGPASAIDSLALIFPAEAYAAR